MVVAAAGVLFIQKLDCRDVHREQLSLEHSMRDLDSAVGRLDNILMSIYTVVALVIVAVALVSGSWCE